MFSFLAVLLNCTDQAITGRIARVQIQSILEREVKTRALTGILGGRKQINDSFTSNSVRYYMHHRKNLSFLSSFELRAVFFQRVLKVRICQHCGVKMSAMTPTFYYFFTGAHQWAPVIYHLLDLLHQCTKFHVKLCQVLLLRNHLFAQFERF